MNIEFLQNKTNVMVVDNDNTPSPKWGSGSPTLGFILGPTSALNKTGDWEWQGMGDVPLTPEQMKEIVKEVYRLMAVAHDQDYLEATKHPIDSSKEKKDLCAHGRPEDGSYCSICNSYQSACKDFPGAPPYNP